MCQLAVYRLGRSYTKYVLCVFLKQQPGKLTKYVKVFVLFHYLMFLHVDLVQSSMWSCSLFVICRYPLPSCLLYWHTSSCFGISICVLNPVIKSNDLILFSDHQEWYPASTNPQPMVSLERPFGELN